MEVLVSYTQTLTHLAMSTLARELQYKIITYLSVEARMQHYTPVPPNPHSANPFQSVSCFQGLPDKVILPQRFIPPRRSNPAAHPPNTTNQASTISLALTSPSTIPIQHNRPTILPPVTASVAEFRVFIFQLMCATH